MADIETTQPARRPSLAPIPPGARIEVIDIVRGIAILGILFVNIQAFSFPEGYTTFNEEAFPGTADSIARWAIAALVEGKFYTLFSILFGLGVAAQASRAVAKGRRFAPLYCRRLLALLIIGLAHDIFLWNGRILIGYALLGFLLIPFWNRQRKTLLIWSTALIAVLIVAGVSAAIVARPQAPPAAQQQSDEEPTIQQRREARMRAGFEEELELLQSGRYLDMVRFRLQFLPRTVMIVVMFTPYMLAIFLVGMWIWKAQIFQQTEQKLGLIRRIAWWGLGLGVVFNLVFLLPRALAESPSMASGLVSMIGFFIGNPALAPFYLMCIILLTRRPFWHRVLRPFAAAGRTALSNYLFQALVCTTLFYGYGFGLFGTVGPATTLLMLPPIFAVQLGLSVWWLRRFRFGPAEWVWRSLTYGKLQPMRRA
jgi:uncharacterized protein